MTDAYTIFKDEPLRAEGNGAGNGKVLPDINVSDDSAISPMDETNDAAGAVPPKDASEIGAGNGQAKDPPPNDTSKAQKKSGLWMIRASDVTPKRVDAIWKDAKGGIRLARGEHTVAAGEPGLGKSQIVIAMAAAITTGGYWPCGEGRAPLGSVVILAAEDSIEHTIVPRLIAAGADLKRVHFVQAAVTEDGKGRRTFNFQADLAKLKLLVKDTPDAELVIIDPVTAYLGKIDSHKNTEVRGVLAPLGELAQECNVAIASVTHFTKGTGSASTKAIDRIIGSVAFIAAPRIGFTVIADPDDPNRRLFLHVKNNISRPPQGLAFRLEQRVVASDEKGDFVASCIAWEGEPVEKTADEALHADGNKEQTAKVDAVEFLTDVLANGPVKVADIEREARAACLLGADQIIGQSKPFRSARKELGIVSYQPKGQKAGGWFWALPEHVPTDAER
jgi:putative DNA primase/helicase